MACIPLPFSWWPSKELLAGYTPCAFIEVIERGERTGPLTGVETWVWYWLFVPETVKHTNYCRMKGKPSVIFCAWQTRSENCKITREQWTKLRISTAQLQYLYFTSTVSLRYLYDTSTGSLQYFYSISTVLLQDLYSISTVLLQYFYSISTVLLQVVYSISTVALHYLYSIFTAFYRIYTVSLQRFTGFLQ